MKPFQNTCTTVIRRINRKYSFASLVVIGVALGTLHAQETPNWPSGLVNRNLFLEQGLGMTQYGNSIYPSALFLAYVQTHPTFSGIGTAYSLDGTNYVDQGYARDVNTGAVYQANCEVDRANLCSVAVTTFRGLAYMAFGDGVDRGLSVVSVTNVPGTTTHQYSLVYHNSFVQLTSAPAMVVTPDGSKLLIRYGTSNTSQINATYNSSFDGNNWNTYPSNGFAPTQDALVNLNGQLFAIEKQNNSQNGVFVSKIDNNGVYIAGTAVQLPGFRTKLGFSGTVYRGNIVLALQEDAPEHYLYTFSSPDGVNWFQNPNYTNRVGSTPAIANLNGGLAIGYIANDSSLNFYGAFTTQ